MSSYQSLGLRLCLSSFVRLYSLSETRFGPSGPRHEANRFNPAQPRVPRSAGSSTQTIFRWRVRYDAAQLQSRVVVGVDVIEWINVAAHLNTMIEELSW